MFSASLQEQASQIADLYEHELGAPSAIGHAGQVQDFLQAIADGNYVETAAQLAGLSKVTVYNWKKRAEEGRKAEQAFVNAWQKAEAFAEAQAVANVRKAGKLPQFWAAEMTYLERRHPERWGRRSEGSNEPRVVVQIGVKDSDVLVQVSTISDSPSTLSPPLGPDIHSVTPTASADPCPIISVPLLEQKTNSSTLQAMSGARSAEGPSPARPRVRRGRGVSAKSRVAGGKEKKA